MALAGAQGRSQVSHLKELLGFAELMDASVTNATRMKSAKNKVGFAMTTPHLVKISLSPYSCVKKAANVTNGKRTKWKRLLIQNKSMNGSYSMALPTKTYELFVKKTLIGASTAR